MLDPSENLLRQNVFYEFSRLVEYGEFSKPNFDVRSERDEDW
jgi:hypothetical protein